jgi:UDP-2,4-diacetamido-2,4,6-trideoxy-beta-L-altropyranose hydrolase
MRRVGRSRVNTDSDARDGAAVAVFRVDGGREVGGGHVARCRALATWLRRRGCRVRFAMTADALASLPSAGCADVESGMITLAPSMTAADEIAMMQAAQPEGCALLLVDHYGRDAAFESACRPWARAVAVIDDLPTRDHACDVLLDQTWGREAAAYNGRVPDPAICLCGSAYALLRDEFRAGRDTVRRTGPARRVFVSMGATDPDDATSVVLAGIAACDAAFETDVVLGAAAPHAEAVRARAATMGGAVRVHFGADDVAALMARADIAIGAAGVTSWERCCLGLPTIMAQLFANQRDVAANLAAAGAVRCIPQDEFGPAAIAAALDDLAADDGARREMSRRARLVADGLGARRAALVLMPERARGGAAVRLRPATMDDAQTILGWQQDADTRRHFRNPEPPETASHMAWMNGRLSDPDGLLNIVLLDESPAGVLRLDARPRQDDAPPEFEVSVLAAPGFKRRGVGLGALNAARALLPEAVFHAEILPGNEASMGLFAAAGYRPAGGSWHVSPPVTG